MVAGETYIDGNEDFQPVAFDVCILVFIELLCGIIPHNHCVLGQLLIETFWRCAVNVEVERLDWDEEAAEWQEGKKGTHSW